MRKWIHKYKTVLSEIKGEGYIDTAVLMVVAVVIGALLLSGLYALFNSVILPGLTDRIQNMLG